MHRGLCARARELDSFHLAKPIADTLRIAIKPEWVWYRGNWDEVARPLGQAFDLDFDVICDVATDTSPATEKPTTDDKRKRFAEFCHDLALHYPLKAIEVWNEPNLATFAISMPVKVSDMTALLRVTTPAIRAARDIPIITGGLTPRGSKPYDSYFKALFKQPGIRDLVDGIGMHPYGGSAKESLAMISYTRQIMDGSGLRDKKIWVTELGWGSSGDGGLEGRAAERSKSLSVQASETRKLMAGLERNAAKWKIAGAFPYTLLDEPPTSHNGSWADSAGVMTWDGKPKPVYEVLAGFQRQERKAA